MGCGTPRRLQPPGDVNVLAGIRGDLLRRHLVHANLVLALLADQFGDRDVLVVQVAAGHVVEVVAALARPQQIVGHHRVAGHAGELDTLLPQNELIVLDVLIDLGDRRVFEHRLEGLQRRRRVEHVRPFRPADGEVMGRCFFPGDRDADEIGPQRVEVGRLQVDARTASVS